MIGKSVRKFLAKKNVKGKDNNMLIKAGLTYIEIRPESGIIRPEKDPIATHGLSLDLVADNGGITKYFDELSSVPFQNTLYFKEYLRYWETDIQKKYNQIKESLKELNNFSQMVGKPQYGLREINPGSPVYHIPAKHDFKTESKE